MNSPDFSWAEVGSRIRGRRLSRGMSQQKLAEAADITQNGVFRIEAGDTNPQLSTLHRIAEALDCSVRDLIVGVSESGPVLVDRLRKVKMIIESGDRAALKVIDNGIETAEALLERSGVRREVPPLKRVLKGEGRQRRAEELSLMHGQIRRASEVDAVPGSAMVQKGMRPFRDSRLSHGRTKNND